MDTPEDRLAEARHDAKAILAIPRERFIGALALNCWLLQDARYLADPADVIAGIAEGLNRAGVPVDRLATYIEVRHSLLAGIARVWKRDAPMEMLPLLHEDEEKYGDQVSPFTAVHETGEPLTINLDTAPDDLFPIVPDLKAEGYRDYYCVPVKLANGMEDAAAYGTKRPGGFDEDDRAILDFVEPAIAALIELLVTRRILNDVTRIYLGNEPSQRILSGDTRRGDLRSINSAIFFADMRGFTTHSMRLPPEDTVRLLNAYYDCVVAPVEERGGEVLKFIGDGVLAIFRMEDGDCAPLEMSLQASRAALEAIDRLNEAGTAPARIEAGIGIHVGRAGYGNVGSGERQDYTVIGSDVNFASRVASLCGQLKRPLLLSASAAEMLDETFHSLGEFALKGVDGDRPIFAPKSANGR